jgi:hypothetical protein
MKMRVITCLLLALLVSLTFFEVCNGAVWFEGDSPQETSVTMNSKLPYPSCHLTLTETEPHTVNLTITVTTWIWYLQNENFETWLSIDSQESKNLGSGILYSNSTGMFGERYSRQYNVILSEIADGAHSINIRVEGEYYMNPEGYVANAPHELGNTSRYVIIGNADFMVDETVSTPQTQVLVSGIALVSIIMVCIAITVCYMRKKSKNAA